MDQGHFLGNGDTATMRLGWIGKDGVKIFRHPYYFLKTQLSLVIGLIDKSNHPSNPHSDYKGGLVSWKFYFYNG